MSSSNVKTLIADHAKVGTMLYDWNRDTLGWIVTAAGDTMYGWEVEFADGLTRSASWYEVYTWMQEYLKLEQGGSRRIRI